MPEEDPVGAAAVVAIDRLGMKGTQLERCGMDGGCLTLGNGTTGLSSAAKGSIYDERAALPILLALLTIGKMDCRFHSGWLRRTRTGTHACAGCSQGTGES